jgi:hypothetical protein
VGIGKTTTLTEEPAMRNKHPGTCYRCNQRVEVGQGHFERHAGGWRTQHADCAIKAKQAKQQTK